MKKHHLDRGKGMVECGKSIKEGMPIAFREGNQFFDLPLVNPIKAIEICGVCLKVNCPGIAKQLASRKAISIAPIAKPVKSKPIAKSNPKKVQLAKFNYPCKVNPNNKCDNELPFDCQLCHRGIELVHLKRIPIIQYKKSNSAKVMPKPIPAPVKSNSKSKAKKGPIQSKLEKDPAVKQLMSVLFPDPSNYPIAKSDKGKVRELRQKGQLKVTNAPAIQAQFNKDDKPIELPAKDIVDPELIKKVRLNFSLRNIGMHPYSDNWIITKLIGNEVKIVSKSITNYKQAFAEFNRLIMIDAEKELKSNSKKK